jgi:hypothetical protein
MKGNGFETVCISMYDADLEECDRMVSMLKMYGHTRANRSALIRFALRNVDMAQAQREGLYGAPKEKAPTEVG